MSEAIDRLNIALDGSYHVESELGSGGMATVYLARDLRQGRQVAVKVLKPELAVSLGPDRFVRETEIATRLTHPHILPVYDSGQADGVLYYVMPYVEGESLRQRLNREKQLPVDDALQIAREVAAALGAAHTSGVVHRDIKPENILLSGGVAVVADFGIARALSTALGQLTATGMAVGTPAYMSPEQAAGEREVDGRSDLYSLGCVLHEMLAGGPPFGGSTLQAITAAKLSTPPPEIRRIRDSVPPGVSQALQKVLARVPADRFQSAEKFAERLRITTADEPLATRWSRIHGPAAVIPWTITAVAVLVAAWLAFTGRTADPATPPTYRFAVPISGDHHLPLGTRVNAVEPVPLAISADGGWLAYVGQDDSGTRLYLRSLTDEFTARPVPGTEGASNPFFSPDGRWIGFAADGMLRRVSVDGGPVQVITEAPNMLGASWLGPDSILFTPDYGGGLALVSASGGTARSVTSPDRSNGEIGHTWPHVLPGGRAALFHRWQAPNQHSIVRLSLETMEQHLVLENAGKPRYLTSGHLAFERFGQVQAQSFDLDNLTVGGTSIPPIDTHKAFFAVSDAGTLVYVPPVFDPATRQLVWVDRTGRSTLLAEFPGTVIEPQLSPDGQRLLVMHGGEQGFGVFVYDLASQRLQRLGTGFFPVWTPDGRSVTWGGFGLFVQPADRAEDPEQLVGSEALVVPTSWSPDGETLLYQTAEFDIWIATRGGETRPLVATDFVEFGARFSPSGQWIAYISHESGQPEIYVQSYTEGDTRRLVSRDGGTDPVWARDGRELFYRRGDEFWSVRIDTDPTLEIGTPQLLFAQAYAAPASHQNYDYDPRRDRFILGRVETIPPEEIRVVLNWYAELQELMPSGQR